MPRKSSYPDWVYPYIQKGQYVNCQNGKYYLYAAHSERREGINHPVRVCDGYLGRLTEDQGLIPAKKRQSQAAEKQDEPPAHSKSTTEAHPVRSYDYGVPACVVACTENTILKGLRKTYRRNGTPIYVRSVCEYLYGVWIPEMYTSSYLSLLFPGLSFHDEESPEFLAGVSRGVSMLTHAVEHRYQDDWPILRATMASITLVEIDKHLICPALSEKASELKKKYALPIGQDEAHALERSACESL